MTLTTEQPVEPAYDDQLPLPTGAYVAPRVNLLPPEVAERVALRKIQAGLAAGVVACAAVVGALYYLSDSGKADAQNRLDTAVAESNQLNGQKSQLAPVAVQRSQIQQARAALLSATSSEVLWSQQLDLVRQHLSENVGLTSFTVTPAGAAKSGTGAATTTTGSSSAAGTTPSSTTSAGSTTPSSTAAGSIAAGGSTPGAGDITSDSGPSGPIIAGVSMSGVANTPTDVANWLDTLDQIPGWSNVYAQNVTAKGSYYTFSLSADIDSTVRANRYATGG